MCVVCMYVSYDEYMHEYIYVRMYEYDLMCIVKHKQTYIYYLPSVIASAMTANRPDDSMALPNIFPPPSRNKVCQDKELKSS